MEYDKLQLIEHKAEKLLSELKNSTESSIYTNALYVIIALFMASLCYLYIKSGKDTLVYASALVIGLIAYKFIVSNAAKELDASTNFLAYKSENKPAYVKGMLQYLASNINVQLSRIKALRTVYMLVFPFLLMMFRQIALGSFGKSEYLFNLIVALLLGALFWYFFFKKPIDEKEADYWEVSNLSKTIKL
ncbi:MAG: hypothetical protein HKO66_08495 [Saprospiraceae bacterium]|nr:hypothetical protein [Bacteroidia bacterium]NNE15399.1 hypothetical protein [Saprospiraceae bacterium]NNL92255.1 hypothetical protein [Saprospiraceae bacterium]